jgi:NarL family two-component system sensor histidine kinase YdfH
MMDLQRGRGGGRWRRSPWPVRQAAGRPPDDLEVRQPLRWFLLAWLACVYGWGLIHLLLLDPRIYKCWYNAGPDGACPPLTLLPSAAHLQRAGVFTALVVTLAALLWLGQREQIAARGRVLYLLAQGGVVFVIAQVVRQDSVVLSLYLALALAAIGSLRERRLALALASGALVLFVISDLVSRGPVTGWMTVLLRIWTGTDYAALALFLIGYLVLYDQLLTAHTQLAVTHVALTEAHDQVRASARQIEHLTRLAERQRLARELHDTLSQGLVGLKLQLEAVDALQAQGRHDQAQAIVRQAVARVQSTLAEARGVITDLRVRHDDTLTFAATLQEAIGQFTAATNLPCRTDLAQFAGLPARFHEHALRVVGEGLTNIARHAQARHAWIAARRDGALLQVEIGDDGIGFTTAPASAQPGHYGLSGLRERASAVGGQFAVSSAPGAGTILRFSFPLAVNPVAPSTNSAGGPLHGNDEERYA